MNEHNVTILPLIFSCPGYCDNGQLALDITKVMDIEGLAKSGAINDLTSKHITLAELTFHFPPVMAIDGCQMQCIKKILTEHHIKPTWHVILSDFSQDNSNKLQLDYASMAKVLRTIQTMLMKK